MIHLLGFQCVRPHSEKSHPFSARLSMNDDHCDHLPDTWCLDWTTPHHIPPWFEPNGVPAITDHCSSAFETSFLWPSLMSDVVWARAFHRRWGRPNGCRLVAWGCAAADTLMVIKASQPPPQQAGYAPMGSLGHHTMAQRAISVDPSWTILGWEVLEVNSYCLGDCHSDRNCADPATGLMPSLEHARALANSIDPQRHQGPAYTCVPIACLEVPEESFP